MDVAHAFEDDLLGRAILPPTHSRIGLAQLGEDGAHFCTVGLRLGIDGDGVNRIGINGLAQPDRLLLVREGIAGAGIGQFGDCPNIARVQRLHGDLLFTAHKQ